MTAGDPSPAAWALVKELFLAALERPPEERDAYLTTACAGDDALRTAVRELLDAHQEEDGFLEAPAVPGVSLAAVREEVVAGRRVGAWELVREIGHGGMGTVFLATRADAQFRMEAALKLVRHGAGGEDILRRFRNERQILANLQHPNIARLLDGGTTDDGLPYFVMEYVDGLPVTDYCDQKLLTTGDRLRLFRAVLSAVQQAHQSLVVHRDLKPSNILVTKEGVPKLLDFGIAKLLAPDAAEAPAAETIASLRLMTPEYASPEQVRGEPVTTLSDIYSLGVILYELLTGHRPYQVTMTSWKDLERVVCEEEPLRPSTAVTRVEELPSTGATQPVRITPEGVSGSREGSPDRLRRRLEGDVDAIVMTALRKEPSERYRSVAQLADDIDRHLSGQPVLARRGTAGYRVSKFVRRHRVGVGAAALVFLSLLAGILATARQARIARLERQKAERRFGDVRKLADAYLFEFDDAIQTLPGARPARQLLVKRAQQYLASLAEEAGGDLSLQRDLAKAYDKVAAIQGNPYHSNLGDLSGALKSYQKALSIRQAVADARPNDRDARRELSTGVDRIGEILTFSGDTAGALARFRQALAIREELAVADPANARMRRDLGVSHLKIGDALVQLGDLKGAVESHRRALACLQQLSAEKPGDVRALIDLSVSQTKVGETLDADRNDAGALEMYRRALQTCHAILQLDATNAIGKRYREISLNHIGDTQLKLGDAAGAAESHRQAVGIAEEFRAADAGDTQAKTDLAFTLNRLGRALVAAGRAAEALPHLARALELAQGIVTAEPKNSEGRAELAEAHERVGDAHAKLGAKDAALASCQAAVAERDAIAAADPRNAQVKHDLAGALLLLGDAQAALSRWGNARTAYQRSLAIWEELRKSGTLRSRDSARPEELRGRLARCDAAVTKAAARRDAPRLRRA